MTIEEIKGLCLKASPGPWTYSTCYGMATIECRSSRESVACAVDYLTPNNADLIVRTPTLILKLVAVAEAAKRHLEETVTALPTEAEAALQAAFSALEAER